jgi:hypothetical protein
LTFDLLERATHIEADRLLDQVEEAERAGLIGGTTQYTSHGFSSHTNLSVKPSLQTSLRHDSKDFILDIANAIENLYPGELDDDANDLAHHLVHAGNAADPARSVRCLDVRSHATALSSSPIIAIA